MKFSRSFHPYAITTILFWALAYVYTRLALRHFTPLPLGFLRYAVAAAALAAAALILRIRPPRPALHPWLALSGALGFFLYMIFFNIGTGRVTAATSSVVIAIAPILTAVLARLFYKEALGPRQWAAVGVEFAGVVVLALSGGALSANAGVLWLLGAALCLGSYNILQRKLLRECTSLQITTYSILYGALMLTLFAPSAWGQLSSAPPAQLWYLLVLGLLSSAVAYLCWARAFALARRTSQVSNYMFLTPLLTGLLGFLLAGELPDGATLLGGAIILGGVALFNSPSGRASS